MGLHHPQWVSFELRAVEYVEALVYWAVFHPEGQRWVTFRPDGTAAYAPDGLTYNAVEAAVRWSLAEAGRRALTGELVRDHIKPVYLATIVNAARRDVIAVNPEWTDRIPYGAVQQGVELMTDGNAEISSQPTHRVVPLNDVATVIEALQHYADRLSRMISILENVDGVDPVTVEVRVSSLRLKIHNVQGLLEHFNDS